MPVSSRILPERGLAQVRFEGLVTVSETGEAFAADTRHSDMRAGQRHLPDMRRVTGWTRDVAGLVQLHAAQLDGLLGAKHEIPYVCFTPDAQTQALAQLAKRSREQVPGVIPLLAQTEAEALDVSGQPERTIDALLQSA